ncbi:AI-2E family transporter [Actinomadura oligospora]|uniref:AI-2E family transporter n=1 Tax=Actinomadura oligospora TaxID=111804 RepID=UPI0004B26E93|nr:AI-2E family transporter [Actinomadura oligospora]
MPDDTPPSAGTESPTPEAAATPTPDGGSGVDGAVPRPAPAADDVPAEGDTTAEAGVPVKSVPVKSVVVKAAAVKGDAAGKGDVAAEEDVAAARDAVEQVEQLKQEAKADRWPFGRPGEPFGRHHPFVFGFTAALGVMTAYLLLKAATGAKSTLVTIVVAMFLAVGLNPAVERLKRLGLSRGWAVAVVFLGVVLFFAGVVASLVPPIVDQVNGLTQNLPHYIEQLQGNKRIADWDRRYHLLQQAQDKLNDSKFQQKMANWAVEAGKQALSGTFKTLTILILTLYFLSSLPQIKAFFYQLVPRTRRARVALLGDEILDRIGGYVAGQFTIAFIAGLTSYVFLEILGVPYALALALIVAVTDLIPLVGATIGAVIVCLVAFLTGTYEGIAALVFYVVYQQVENYLVYPRVMKRTVDVQPAVTIVAALIGAALLGVVGALIAIPTAAAISLLIREIVLPRQESA